MKEIWIVKGIVTDPEAHDGTASVGDTEWTFSDGPPGERGSSADYLSLEAGLAAHPDAIFRYVPDEPETEHEFTVTFTVPHDELMTYWKEQQELLSLKATLAAILQRDLYDEAGMSGGFEVQ